MGWSGMGAVLAPQAGGVAFAGPSHPHAFVMFLGRGSAVPESIILLFVHLLNAPPLSDPVRGFKVLLTTFLCTATCQHPLAQAGAQHPPQDSLPFSDTPIFLGLLKCHGVT